MVGLSDEEKSAHPGEKLDTREGKRNPGEPLRRFVIGNLRTLDELLEPGAGRLARPVLRGRGGGDITSLPDQLARTITDTFLLSYSNLSRRVVLSHPYKYASAK